jgi:hypothetical protein
LQALKENAASVVFPFVWVVCGFGTFYVIKAAIHLRREMVAEVAAYKPAVHGYSPSYLQPTPQSSLLESA